MAEATRRRNPAIYPGELGQPGAAPFGTRLRTAWRVLFGDVLRWNDPAYVSTRTSEERALRFIMAVLFLQRASYLIPASVAIFTAAPGTYTSTIVNALLVTAAVAWNLVLLAIARKRGWFPRWSVWADVTFVLGLVAMSTRNLSGGDVLASQNWPTRLALAAIALVAASFAPAVASLGIGLVLSGLFAAALGRVDAATLPASSIVSFGNACLWFGVVAHFMRRYLCGQGRVLDRIQSRQVEAEALRAAREARANERAAQYRTLHNTVLSTLTAIARGGLDHRGDELRARCAAEAAYLRSLITDEPASANSGLQAALTDVIADMEALGLTVHFRHAGLPEQVPEPVTAAFADAAREALNNVARHSGSREAWLTAFATAGAPEPESGPERSALTVRIVDRGCGFDPRNTTPGFGIPHSIMAHMADAGGLALVDSAPGEGTCVELTYELSAGRDEDRPPAHE